MAAKKVVETGPKLSFKEKAAELEKKFHQDEPDRTIIPTGSISLDYGIGGGYRTGRIYEYISWEGGGKSTLCQHAVAETQKIGGNVAYIDGEHALDEVYARAIGVDWDKLKPTLFQPDCGEDGFEYAKELIKTGELRLLILDSINGLRARKEMEDPAGSSNLGLHARLIGTEIVKIQNLASRYNTAVICVSQIREKIGVMFGSPETTQGGNALKFWASGRIELRRQLEKEGTDVVGIKTKFKVVKNKIVSPYRTGEIPIEFGVGIDKLKEVINLGKEFDMLAQRAGIITYDGTKYPEKDFRDMLNDNPEFYNSIKDKIILRMPEHKAVAVVEA